MLSGAIIGPFAGAIAVLQYFDQRFRKEGFDIELRQPRPVPAAVLMSFALLPGAAMRGPLHPDADTAREWLRQELLRREYRPNLVQRMQDWFQELLGKANGTGSLGGLGDTVAARADGGGRAAARVRALPAAAQPGADRAPEAVFGDVRRTAAEHRRLARAAYDTGAWDDAVVEGMRALAAGLVERQLVDDVPAATAHEVTSLAAPRFPPYADRLEAAATGLRRDAVRRPPCHPRARRARCSSSSPRSRVPVRPTEAMPAVRWSAVPR